MLSVKIIRELFPDSPGFMAVMRIIREFLPNSQGLMAFVRTIREILPDFRPNLINIGIKSIF